MLNKNKKLGQLLIESDLITEAQLNKALDYQKKQGGRIGEALVSLGIIGEDKIQEILADKLNVPKLSLNDIELDKDVVNLIPAAIARQYSLIAIFKINNILTVAMSDPLNFVAIDKIVYLTNLEIKRLITTRSEIENAIDKYYTINETMGQTMDKIESDIIVGDDDRITELKDLDDISSDLPVVDLANAIIIKAIKRKASDIHIQPDNQILKVRYRVDGLMQEVAILPIKILSPLLSRFKVMSNIDVSEKRLPQDGRFRLHFNNNEIDFRISTLPSIYGEKIVIRILDKSNLVLDLSEMGFSSNNYSNWLKVIERPEGFVLITGPTGSGKTTTLYAVLNKLNKPEKNIMTVEDPVEYKIGNITQVQINEKAGLHFSNSLRSIVRQNPDILMVGEIRDLATAEIAVRASLTGHLVLSTLHTSDAPVTPTRLIDMGLEPYLVSSSLTAVLAQRLVRTICPNCKIETQPDDAVKLSIIQKLETPDKTFYYGKGCPRCNQTGYRGRTAIHELLIMSPNLKEMIIRKVSHVDLRHTALNEGMISLFDDGLAKVFAGITTIEEVLRVTHFEDRLSDNRPAVEVLENALQI
jgi:type IV pilus assembly protein PilB